MHRPARVALLGATALLTAALASTSTPAHAGLLPTPLKGKIKTMATHVREGITENRLPLIGGAPVGLPLQYGGGKVEVTNTNYAIFWEPSGHASAPGYQSLITRFFNDVGGSALFNTTTQYYQDLGSGQQSIQNFSTFGGAIIDTTPFPAGGVTDADLQSIVKKYAGHGYPLDAEYFVYTGPGGEVVSSYCAYHSYVTISGVTTRYADEPYGGQSGCETPASPNGNAAADSAINTTSHELWESITDPNTGDGWVALDGDEGSDECNFLFGSQDAAGADVYLKGHPYILQEEWDNSAAPFGCTMG